MIRFCIALLLSLIAIGPVAAEEPAAPPAIAGVRVGFAGYYRVGLWTPVTVTLQGGSQPGKGRWRSRSLTATACPAGTLCPPQGPAGCRPAGTTVTAYVKFGRVERDERGIASSRRGGRLADLSGHRLGRAFTPPACLPARLMVSSGPKPTNRQIPLLF